LILRLIIQLLLPKGSHYIPGFIPFFYLIYTKNSSEESIKFNLDKKFTFSLKKKVLINQSFLKNSNEFAYIEQVIKISEEYRFFHKWNSMIPFIRENKRNINVVLILTESYSRTRSYFLSVVIDKETKQILSREDGFGSFKTWQGIEF
jgi:hypothetical protein